MKGLKILMLGLLLVGSVRASTLTVCPAGCEYSNIQNAINISSAGDTIMVESGTYFENINVNKKLTLLGTGNPVVKADRNRSAILLSADGITLEGFTVNGSYVFEDAGTSIVSGSSELKADDPVYDSTYGVYLLSNNHTIRRNNLSNNLGFGIYLRFSDNNTIIGNNIRNSYPGGIYLEKSSRNVLESNIVSENYDIGIFVSDNSDNNALKDNNVSSTIPIYWSSGTGIVLVGSNNTIDSNNVSDNIYGISLSASNKNILRNNIMNKNEYNFGMWTDSDSVFDSEIDMSNLVDGKTVYYLTGAKDIIYDSDANIGTFYCINCINITLRDLDLRNNDYGIFLWNTSGSKIQNVNASNNGHGISLYYSSDNTVSSSRVGYNCEGRAFGQDYGIYLHSSGNNTFIKNNVSDNCYGISLEYHSNKNTLIDNNFNSNNARTTSAGIHMGDSSGNALSGNKVSDNDYGIILESNKNRLRNNKIFGNGLNGISLIGKNNILTGNIISNNGLYYGSPGISISSSGNFIYNNIFNNTNNIEFYESSAGSWNITMRAGVNIVKGPNLGGNFWANVNGTGFGQTCSDVNIDGFCDEPYVLDLNNIDYLPLSYKAPSIRFSSTTPENGANITQNYVYINTTVVGSTAFIDWKRSLAGWWRFNGEGGESSSFFKDWSGRKNNASCTGSNCPAEISGKFGNALDFDGVDDYIDAGNGKSVNIKGAITIEAWVNPGEAQEKCQDDAHGNYGVMSKSSSAANSTDWSWQLRYGAPGGGCYLGFNFNGRKEGSRWISMRQNLIPGKWYHVAGTFNGTDIVSYLDGNIMDTNRLSSIRGYSNRLFIGTDGWGNSFNGKIDEVRIHRRALSPEEIKAAYNAGIYDLYRNFTDLASGSYNYRAYTQNLQGKVSRTEKRILKIN